MSTIKPPPTYQAKSRLMNAKGDVEQSRHVASAEKLRDPPINGIRPGHHSIPIAAANRSTSAGGSASIRGRAGRPVWQLKVLKLLMFPEIVRQTLKQFGSAWCKKTMRMRLRSWLPSAREAV